MIDYYVPTVRDLRISMIGQILNRRIGLTFRGPKSFSLLPALHLERIVDVDGMIPESRDFWVDGLINDLTHRFITTAIGAFHLLYRFEPSRAKETLSRRLELELSDDFELCLRMLPSRLGRIYPDLAESFSKRIDSMVAPEFARDQLKRLLW